MATSTNQNIPRDAFLYLLSIITLIISAVSLGTVVFQYINVYIPDIISDPYLTQSSYLGTMRYALATLVIVFPVFVWVSWFLRKDISKFPEKRELKIRRWLLYLTLFVATLVIIGDLVVLLRSFLEGELSQRFVLKILAILFIAGSIFVHYLSELKDRKGGYKRIKIFDWAIVAVVLASIVAGFFIAGSPMNQRLIKMDERRVSDLQTIQWQIINYWQRKESLPVSLNDLADPISGFIVPKDSQTGQVYEYNVLGGLKFELCAVFSTTSLDEGVQRQAQQPKAVPIAIDGRSSYISDVWWHDVGRVCFERTIDPDLYPPLNNKDIKPQPL
ncbi:MAG: hypothetical protein A3C61_01255 [Candidatus Yanofskybacteria bacterium RIFCSPHIGHO2_02_FULL_39_10]|uniref:DUF5671 domain-containing protein n=1 Tax=Candidatus Yanofskybacteria bacterium RIFCSPHIGHO2_02_FULL_39_10 TaxID=1802674 RepID=A0A1F8FA55_9BACT|nr:MAG: hypothetical protein A3C61_01255 [Candidatus Yanofskybacteria bacterium RIFCSPHIGHO2_02_FULL_39_10]